MEFIFNLREQYLFEKLLFIGQLIFWVFCYFFLFFSNQRWGQVVEQEVLFIL